MRLPNLDKNPRRNIGGVGEDTRTEADFIQDFESVYFARKGQAGLASGEFALAGFGIADLVWIGWKKGALHDEFTALSLEKKLNRRQLYAFEGKIHDWQKALQQAFRYRYFADKYIVVMTREKIVAARRNLPAFERLGVGLWWLDQTNQTIRELYTPTRIRAFSPQAKQKAIRKLTSNIDFCQFGE